MVVGGRRVLVEARLFVRAGVARCAAGVPTAVRAVVDAARALRRSATSAASFLTRLRSFFSALLVLAIRSFSTRWARTRAWQARSPIVNHVITPGSLTFRSLSKTLNPDKQAVLTSHDILDGLKPLAGGIILRHAPVESPEVLLVRHSRSRGWGFPKGKLERGETAREAALREVREETGLRCRCQGLVGSVVYRTPGGRSRVATYWYMTPVRGGFRVGSEIDKVEWVSLERAAERMAGRPEAALLPGLSDTLASVETADG